MEDLIIGQVKVRLNSKQKYATKRGGKKYWRVSVGYPARRIQLSRFIVECLLGKALSTKAVVHHINEDTLDDQTKNLVVCENNSYHYLLHQRTEAYRATGNANSRRCEICKEWGIPGDGDMVVYRRRCYPTGNGKARHKSCHNNQNSWRRGGKFSACYW